MSSVITPNMSLVVPTPGNEQGPQYALDIGNSLTIIDGHNHSSGSGVQITPSGLNINSALTLNNNSLTAVQAITYQIQSADPANQSAYMKGVDFYLKDGNGNVIRLTQSGSVAGSTGTITGLPSGTASASFSAGTFVFESATNTAANIDGASYILRNNTVSSKGLTLQPPNAMGSNYSLTLPSTPAQTNVMTLDSSGNMGSITYDQVGVNMTATGANAIAASRTRSTGSPTEGLGGVCYSVGSGGFFTNSTTAVDVTHLSVTITTSGRPIFIGLIGDPNAPTNNPSFLGADAASNGALFFILNGASIIATNKFVGSSSSVNLPPSCLSTIDLQAAGTYTYKIQALVQSSAGTAQVNNSILVAYEL